MSRTQAVANSVGLRRCKYSNPATGIFTYTYDPSFYSGRRLYELTFRVKNGDRPSLTQVKLELYDATGVTLLGWDAEQGEHEAFLKKVHQILAKSFPLAPEEEQVADAAGCLVMFLLLGGGLGTLVAALV